MRRSLPLPLPHHPAHHPTRAVLVPTSAFSTNKRGYPALSRRHQELLADCFRRGVQVGRLRVALALGNAPLAPV